jgi:hypothetical protein
MVSAESERDLLGELQRWYLAQCDGEWEHSYGVKIATLESRGWTLKVNLEGTGLASRSFRQPEIRRSSDDWVVCRRDSTQFHAYCGPPNLTEALACFLDWAAEEAG